MTRLTSALVALIGKRKDSSPSSLTPMNDDIERLSLTDTLEFVRENLQQAAMLLERATHDIADKETAVNLLKAQVKTLRMASPVHEKVQR